MKTLLLLLILTCNKPHPIANTTAAYICTGAKKYHLNSNCRGLSSCQHKILKMSVAEAQRSGKTLCRWEK